VAVQASDGEVLYEITLDAKPTGVALAPDQSAVLVTCAGNGGHVEVLDRATGAQGALAGRARRLCAGGGIKQRAAVRVQPVRWCGPGH
jgi:hypothetical protein